MCDKNDEIVLLSTSLMVGIANELSSIQTTNSPALALAPLAPEKASEFIDALIIIQKFDNCLSSIMESIRGLYEDDLVK